MENEQFMNAPERIEETRKMLRLNQGEMGVELGLGRTMYHYVKSGEREIGNKALRELERLEGIVLRSQEGRASLEHAAEVANALKGKVSKREAQAIFEKKVAQGQADIFQRREAEAKAKLLKVEKELAGLKRKLRKLGEE